MRLIDADALKRKFKEESGGLWAMVVVDSMPTVDAVPVVRCEDCRYWGKDGFNDFRKCSIDGAWHRASFYCACAERKAAATES